MDAILCRALRAGIVVFGLVSSLPLGAQNLLQNPGFAAVLDPWRAATAPGQTMTWNSFDVGGDPNSGSALVTVSASSSNRQPAMGSQCVAIQPNTAYVYGGKAYLPTATSADGADAFVSAQFFPSADCNDSVDVFDFSMHVSTRDAWNGMLGVIASGPSDQSVQIYPYVDAPTGTNLQMYFDDMFLMPDAIFRGTFN